MSLEYFFAVVVVGVLAGCGAHLLARYRGFGLIGDVVVALIGGFVGAWVLPAVGLSFANDTLTGALTAAVGAVAVLVALRALKRA